VPKTTTQALYVSLSDSWMFSFCEA
jgi:hypothetical protein